MAARQSISRHGWTALLRSWATEAVRPGDGLTITTVAAVAGIGFGADKIALGLTCVLLVFATLESVFNFCAGCWLFYVLMKAGVIPEDVCVECAQGLAPVRQSRPSRARQLTRTSNRPTAAHQPAAEVR